MGPKTIVGMVDQLLGYATWRGTKTAVLIFNPRHKYVEPASKNPDAMRAHPNFKGEINVPGETAFRFVLAHRDDSN